MLRLDALKSVYDRLTDRVVITIMGAVAAELQAIGHRPNQFYLQHAMGLASSMGLGVALTRPELSVVVFDGDGSVLMNLGGLTTLARYRPRNLAMDSRTNTRRRPHHLDIHRRTIPSPRRSNRPRRAR